MRGDEGKYVRAVLLRTARIYFLDVNKADREILNEALISAKRKE
jgi:hypothetical protein